MKKLCISWSPGLLLFLVFLAIYARTSAPSVLSGDSAEFQMAAPLLGVPHPTTYPLYMLLGKLSTLLPFRDLAWRVTLVSSVCGALAVALLFALARRVTGAAGAALVAALALGFAPGLWNTATLAEVYALLAALLAALALLLLRSQELGKKRSLYFAAFVGGLGFSHHGLFTFTGLPLLAAYLGWRVWLQWAIAPGQRAVDERAALHSVTSSPCHLVILSPRRLVALTACFALGLTPWLYPLVQYARYGPFVGEQDYGLPTHYFWGAPRSWAGAINLLFGGPIRQGIFRVPSLAHIGEVTWLFVTRLGFEFGPLGCALGVVGCIALWRRNRTVWLGAAWVIVGTWLYVVLLGRAVQDADVFTLPMLLPWALWVGVGAAALTKRAGDQPTRPAGAYIITAGLLVLTLAWGYTRLPYTHKRFLYLFRDWGQAMLQVLPPRAVVVAHWEQGMTLQYLVLAEKQRPDVFIDVVEPGDDAWGARARRRYADRPVFFVGSAADVAGLPVVLARDAEYAKLYRLAGP